MKASHFNQHLISICLSLVLLPSTSLAGIYKWTDANGQTHYSEKKEDADKAKALDLKVQPEPASTNENNSLMQKLQEQERQSNKLQEQRQRAIASRPPADTRPVSLSGGRVDETNDASRCNLARDVLSGAVRHSNGKPTDANDREIAEADIRAFCH